MVCSGSGCVWEVSAVVSSKVEVPKTDVCLLRVQPIAWCSILGMEQRLPLAFRCAWLGGSGAHNAVHVLPMLTGPNPHAVQSRGGRDSAGESVSITVPATAWF